MTSITPTAPSFAAILETPCRPLEKPDSSLMERLSVLNNPASKLSEQVRASDSEKQRFVELCLEDLEACKTSRFRHSCVSIFLIALTIVTLASGIFLSIHNSCLILLPHYLGLFLLSEEQERFSNKIEDDDFVKEYLTNELYFLGHPLPSQADPSSFLRLRADYYLCKIGGFLIPNRLKSFLSGSEDEHFTLIPSVNRGRKEDIPRFTESNVDEGLSQVARRHHISVTPEFVIQPFSGGICFGSTTLFAREYLRARQNSAPETEAIIPVASLFTDGAPFEAALFQAKFSKVLFGYNFGEEERDASGKMTFASHHRAAYELAGLSSESRITDLTYHNATQAVSSALEGVYQIGIPPRGKGSHGHAVLLILEKERCALFDPNFGTLITSLNNRTTIVEGILKSYGADEERANESGGGIDITKLRLAIPDQHSA